jgi:hypothetical protein
MQHLLYFQDFSYLYYAQLGFMIWILVDASRRRADAFWYWIIIGVPGVGAWAYFFAVKAKDFRGGAGLNLWPFHRRVSLAELRYRVGQSPTLTNHLELAERLQEGGAHAEAKPHLEAVLAREPDHCQALHGLAVCHLELGHPDLAVPLLQKIIARDRTWGNYDAWRKLIDARLQSGDADGALETCRQLVQQSPTLEHKCSLAERLLAAGNNDEAGDLLERGLETYQFAPAPIRRRDRRWAKQAKQLLKSV